MNLILKNGILFLYMKRFALFICCLFFIIPTTTRAQEINAGFVQGLWFSSNEIIEGVPVRVYTALRNNTPHDLLGTVRFMDNGKRIGSMSVSALSGRLVEAWTDWTPGPGEHSLSVTLSDAELHVIGGEVIQADVAGIALEETVVADIDTDEDGIGNENDIDDDNDGISDADEIAQGSNPLVADKKPAEEDAVARDAEADTEPASDTEGLEKFLDDGIASSLLANVTDKIENAKQSLDAYRDERNTPHSESPSEVAMSSYENNATITRSTIETKGSFFGTLMSGISAIWHSIYSVILWILSGALAHPALIQVILLLGILYMLYRTMRRLTRRRF